MKRKLSSGEITESETKDIPEQALPPVKEENGMPVKPKRPQTAYFQFLADFRFKVKDMTLKEGDKIPCLAARDWQKMTEIEKKPYKDKLTEKWKKYEEDLAEYKKEVLRIEQSNLQEQMENAAVKPCKTEDGENSKNLAVTEGADSSNDTIENNSLEMEKVAENSDKQPNLDEGDVQCICCGAVLDESYAIWFRKRYYCSKECLPEETSRGYRLGKIIKSGGNYLDRKERRQTKFSAFAVTGIKEVAGCPTPGCNGKGHVTGKYSSHRGVLNCPVAQREFKKKSHRSDSVDSKESESNKCPTPGCDGSGHIKGGMFSSHRSLYGCPRRNSFSKEFDLESRGSSDSLASFASDAVSKRGKGRGRARAASECATEDLKEIPNENSLDASMEELFDESASSEELEKMDNSGEVINPLSGVDEKKPRGRGRSKKRSCSKESLWDITEGEGNVLRLKRKSSNARCEFPGCSGEGHVTGKFIKHRSLYGCPLAAKLSKETDGCPYPGCDGVGHVVPGLLTHDSLSGCPMVAKVMVPSDIEVRCPIPSCDGRGHITGKFSTHRSATACPRAALLLEGKISYSSVEEEEIVNSLYEKNPESFAKSKNAVSSAITEEEILACDERFADEGYGQECMSKAKKASPSKREDPVVTMCKEIEILGAVNAEFEEKNLELKRKVEELEAECKSVTEDVLVVKTDEERLREEYQVCKRKILYSLSRVDLGVVGVKPNLKDFDSLIETLSNGFKKQKKNYEIVLKEIRKTIACSDL